MMSEYLRNVFCFWNDFPGIVLLIVATLSVAIGCRKDRAGNWRITHPLAPFYFLPAIFGLICDFSLRVSISLVPLLKQMNINTLYIIPASWLVYGLCFFLLALIFRNFIDSFLHPTSYFIKAGFSWKAVGEFLDSSFEIKEGKVIVNGIPWDEDIPPSTLLKFMSERIMILALLQPLGIRVAEQLGVSLFCSWPSFFLFFLPLVKCLFYIVPLSALSLYVLVASPYLLLSKEVKN